MSRLYVRFNEFIYSINNYELFIETPHLLKEDGGRQHVCYISREKADMLVSQADVHWWESPPPLKTDKQLLEEAQAKIKELENQLIMVMPGNNRQYVDAVSNISIPKESSPSGYR